MIGSAHQFFFETCSMRYWWAAASISRTSGVLGTVFFTWANKDRAKPVCVPHHAQGCPNECQARACWRLAACKCCWQVGWHQTWRRVWAMLHTIHFLVAHRLDGGVKDLVCGLLCLLGVLLRCTCWPLHDRTCRAFCRCQPWILWSHCVWHTVCGLREEAATDLLLGLLPVASWRQ